MKKEICIFVIFCFSCFINFSCIQKSNQEKQLSIAIVQFQREIAEIGMEGFSYFIGPTIVESIDGVLQDSNTTVYGWYYFHERDTFWIYSTVYKDPDFIKKGWDTGIGYSLNFNELRMNWKKWTK